MEQRAHVPAPALGRAIGAFWRPTLAKGFANMALDRSQHPRMGYGNDETEGGPYIRQKNRQLSRILTRQWKSCRLLGRPTVVRYGQ